MNAEGGVIVSEIDQPRPRSGSPSEIVVVRCTPAITTHCHLIERARCGPGDLVGRSQRDPMGHFGTLLVEMRVSREKSRVKAVLLNTPTNPKTMVHLLGVLLGVQQCI